MTTNTSTNPLKRQNAKEAREQAAEYLGFMASEIIDLADGKTIEIPNPSLLDPDQQDRYDELEFQCESLDRWPDPLNEDGTPKIGADGQPMRGAIRVPHRLNGVRQENYETRLARAILGDDYNDAIASGFYPSQIGVHWAVFRQAVSDREAADPKSEGDSGPVDELPETDSSGA
jgi:hypothetical protein